jgi:hypothetical protein
MVVIVHLCLPDGWVGTGEFGGKGRTRVSRLTPYYAVPVGSHRACPHPTPPHVSDGADEAAYRRDPFHPGNPERSLDPREISEGTPLEDLFRRCNILSNPAPALGAARVGTGIFWHLKDGRTRRAVVGRGRWDKMPSGVQGHGTRLESGGPGTPARQLL